MENKEKVAEALLEIADGLEKGDCKEKIRVGLTTPGSEHGEKELLKGARLADQKVDYIEPVLIGREKPAGIEHHSCQDLESAHTRMEKLLETGEIDCAVTLHYSFPLGTATVGRVIAPCSGQEMLIATTTGSSASDRVEAMVKNALAGLASAGALGIDEPELGILNVEGARKTEQKLLELQENGLGIKFAESARGDGGRVMRGNDLLLGSCDVMVCDTLTGNLLMKLFSAREGGGNREVVGFGYGPGIGEGQDGIIGIISRASGAAVISGAIKYIAEAKRGNLLEKYEKVLQEARTAGLEDILAEDRDEKTAGDEDISAPPEKNTDAEIAGLDVLDIEKARQSLWQEDIYAETGMGCSGPVVMVAREDQKAARSHLEKKGYI